MLGLRTSFLYDKSKEAGLYSPLSGVLQRPKYPSRKYSDENYTDDEDANIIFNSLYTEDDQTLHIWTFARRLAAEDLNVDQLRDMGWSEPELKEVLKDFAGRLHEDSKIPFHWEISAMMHQNIDRVVGVWTGAVDASYIPTATFSREQWEQQVYDSFICGSSAFRWLLSNLRGRSVLSAPPSDAMTNIKAEMMRSFPQRIIKELRRQEPMPTIVMRFHLNWNPKAYFDDLGISSLSLDIWEHILCLTGSWVDAQATTVAEYVRQTWPTTGDVLLTFLYELLCTPEHVVHSKKTSKSILKGSRIVGTLATQDLVSITIKSGRYLVTDIAEQLAWLAATLQLSSRNNEFWDVKPGITQISVRDDLGKNGDLVRGTCRIVFAYETASDVFRYTNGSCWLRLFADSILVRGYPTLCRLIHDSGLEISLKAMAYLMRSTQVVQYEHRLLMKGFNSLLIATYIESGVVLWHAVANDRADERISYFDSRIDELDISHENAPTLRGLETARHFIGWCSEAVDLCGHPDSTLNVTTSRLPPPPSSTYIDRLYVEAGMYFIAGMNMHVNQKEKQTQLGKATDYPSRLKWVGTQFLAFYDVSARRAWLVDGASALLHLVRISLHLDETDPESVYDWKYEKTRMKEDWIGSTGRQAAQNTLKDWSNYDLPVYVKGHKNGVPEHSTFGERVEKVLRDLEILIDLQVWLASPSGIKVTQDLDSRKEIAGFDVRDLLSPPGPIARRIARFDSRGGGWYDLIPSLGVVTIFGKSFGQLIRPEDPDRVCPEWRSIPDGHDYLVSTVSTLKHLYDKRFDKQYPATSKMSWRSPKNEPDACECVRQHQSDNHKHYDPAHFIVSNSLLQNWRLKDSTSVDVRTLNPKGAIVFANLSLTGQRIWAKTGDAGKLRVQDTASSASNSTSAGSSIPLDSMASSTMTQSAASTDATDISNNTADSPDAGTAPTVLSKGKGKRDKMKHFFGSLTKR